MSNLINPYLSPETNSEQEVNLPTGQGSSIYGAYRDARGIAKKLIFCLSLSIIASVLLSIWDGLYYMEIAAGDLDGMTRIEDSALMIVVPFFIVYLLTIVVFSMWTNRIVKNTWAFNSERMSISPGWAVGWYFVPVASLWKPIEAIRQVRDTFFGYKKGLNLTAWWAFWLITNFAGRISMKMPADTIEQIEASTLFDLVTSPLDIMSAVFALLMVKKLTNRQHKVVTAAAC